MKVYRQGKKGDEPLLRDLPGRVMAGSEQLLSTLPYHPAGTNRDSSGTGWTKPGLPHLPA